jgi:itaconate CoA-transferase
VGISVADIACGKAYAIQHIDGAAGEDQDRRGVALELPFHSLAEWMSYAAYYTFGGSAPQRSGANHATIAPYGPVMSGDNKVVYLGLQNEREWKKFCEVVLERPELFADSRFDSNAKRVQNRPQLDLAMQRVFQKLTAAEIVARLSAQIANARSNTMKNF